MKTFIESFYFFQKSVIHGISNVIFVSDFFIVQVYIWTKAH